LKWGQPRLPGTAWPRGRNKVKAMLPNEQPSGHASRRRPDPKSRPHDPAVCGLDWETDCDACREQARANDIAECRRDVVNRRWRRIVQEHQLLRQQRFRDLPRHALPEPDADLLGRLVVLLLDQQTWELLAKVILDALCDYAPDLEDFKPCHVIEIHDAALAYLDTLGNGEVRPEHRPHEVELPASKRLLRKILLGLTKRPEAAQVLARILHQTRMG
jgi:hypothetical protein